MERRYGPGKLAAALAGLLLVGSTVQVVLAPTAAAAGTCEFSNTLCLWDQPQFNGERFTVRPLVPGRGTCVDLVEHGWGQRARSAINNNNRTASLFASADCTGRPFPVDPNARVPSLSFAANSVFVS